MIATSLQYLVAAPRRAFPGLMVIGGHATPIIQKIIVIARLY